MTSNKLISELPPGLEEQIPAIRDKWVREFGLNTKEADEATMRQSLVRLYEANGLVVPEIHVCDSPWAILVLRSKMLGLDKVEYVNFSFFGGQECYWLATYDLARQCGVVYGEETDAPLDAYIEYSRNCGWCLAYPEIAFVSHRPTVMKYDEQDRAHCEDGPAFAYRDGFEVYVWRGVRIPAWYIKEKEKLTPKYALSIENAEERRVACEIIGWDKVLEHPDLNPKVIDEDEPRIGTLMSVDLPDAPNQWFLKYQCGTGRWFAESVNDKTYNTALKANAGGNGWRGNGDPMSYIPFIRT